MLEHSVLSEDDLRSILADRYGISEVENIRCLKGGSANCYAVRSPEGEFILKEFQSKYSLDDVKIEPEVTEFVRTHGIPATKFRPTLIGQYVWEYRDRVFHLQEFIEGTIFAQNNAPDWLLRASAVLLGRLHQALHGFPLMKDAFHSNWITQWNPEQSKQQYSALLAEAKQLPSGHRRERILDDLDYKIEQLPKVARIHIDPAKLTRRNSHGDYHVLQLICGPQCVRAVIDFSGACMLPAIWEVIRSYSLADPKCKQGQLCADNLKNYVSLYMENGGELTRYDLQMMPYLYYFQLIRSKYGYMEYLSKGQFGFIIDESEPLDRLLEFGFWRTNMCRWLEEHAEWLSDELVRFSDCKPES